VFTSYVRPVDAGRYYYSGKLKGGVSGRTWAIAQNTYNLYGRTVNYYDAALNAIYNWNSINPTTTSNVDVSFSHTSNFSSATLKFVIDVQEDVFWDGAAAYFDSNNNPMNPYSDLGDWSSAVICFNAYYTNLPECTSSMLKALAGHEIGHTFGLDDVTLTSDRYKLMWYETGPYRASGITTDEINWIRIIYSN